MKNNYIKLIYKLSLLLVPIIFIITLYLYLDPFKVIYKYSSYYPCNVGLDEDYVSTQTFINNFNKYHYNAFIFGNSRSGFYQVNSWKKYINTDNCFHFDASSESLLGINRKFKFLKRNHVDISFALLIMDYSILNKIDESKGHLFLSHPVLSNQNLYSFQLEFFKAFISHDFFLAYLDYKFSNKVKDYMKKGYLLDDDINEYNLKWNESKHSVFEKLINTNPSIFYDKKKLKSFYARGSNQNFSNKVINKTQYKMLNEIYGILKENKTAYKIIISPLYDQIKLDTADIQILNKIFGVANIYDFSGINFITNDYHNYYETSHYRPHVADYILKEIYK